MLHHKAGERHCKIVAEPLFAHLRSERTVEINFRKSIPGVKDPVQQLIPLLTVFSEQGAQVFHGGSFYLGIAVCLENGTYGIEDIIARSHLRRAEISGSLGYRRFL